MDSNSSQAPTSRERSGQVPRRTLSILSKNFGFEQDGALKAGGAAAAAAATASVLGKAPVLQTSTGMKVGTCSKVGYVPSSSDKINQDSLFEHVKLDSGPSASILSSYFGVADGHGVYGHLVSDLVRKKLPMVLSKDPAMKKESKDKDIKDALIKAHSKVSDEIMQSGIDVNFSGSTCVSVLLRNSSLFCSNVGDSRAVLGRKQDSAWTAISLSNDHKPELPEEKRRITAKRGRVEPYKMPNGEFIGPHRVWLRDQDIPGLGMSRSFGDAVAASVGVTAEPEIQIFPIKSDDKIVVIGSDGVYEFMSNEDVINLVSRYHASGDAQEASIQLVREAQNRWRDREEVIDDTTCIVIFL
jgi:serine/threonine protein phosphatase PrpC